jgi:hypothetical protein
MAAVGGVSRRQAGVRQIRTTAQPSKCAGVFFADDEAGEKLGPTIGWIRAHWLESGNGAVAPAGCYLLASSLLAGYLRAGAMHERVASR